MENKEINPSPVYVIEVRGNDYYDQLEFHSVYATQEAAEAHAAELRALVDEDQEDLLLYDFVKVSKAVLR